MLYCPSAIKMLFCTLCLLLCLARYAVPQTCNVELSREERIKRIGANIINQMGLSEAPENPKVPVFVPEEKMAEFSALQQSAGILTETESCAEPAGFATEKITFRPFEAKALRSNPNNFHNVFHDKNGHSYGGKRDLSTISFYSGLPPTTYKLSFDLDLTKQRMFTSAELVIFKKIISPKPRTLITDFETVQVLLVYKKYYYYYNHLIADERKEIIATRFLSTDEEEFVTFNVTGAIKKWLQVNHVSTGEINLEVRIRCPEMLSSFKNLPPLIEFEIGQPSSNSTAILVVSVVKKDDITDMSSSGRTRLKRQESIRLDSDFCFGNPSEPNCCVRQLKINFEEDLGYSWILSPEEYYPNYCTGLCPYLWPTISDNTRLLQLYRESNPTGAVEPCCAPEIIKPLIIMFAVNGELVLQLINNMEVDNCICR